MDEIQPQGSTTPGTTAPGIVDRAKAILVSPNQEWPKIATETDSVRDVFMRYVVPLAAIGPIAGFIGGQLFGYGAFGFRYHPSLVSGLSTAITGYVLALVSIFVVAWVANFLADKFAGQPNYERAFRLCAYAYTAGWLAGIVRLLPSLGILVLLASLYGIYLFYLGATPMMSVPRDKAAGYTAVTIIGVIVIALIVAALTSAIAGMFGTAAMITANDTGSNIGRVEMNLPGYGKIKVQDNGDNQTMEIPGVGTVHVTKTGDTVKIDGANASAVVKDVDAGK